VSGSIVDTAGEVLGTHSGIAGFTVGQRRGLGIGGGPARYVLKVIPDQQEIVVGDAEDLLGSEVEVHQPAWLGEAPREPFEALVRIRYRHEPAAATVTPSARGFRAVFREKQRALTPGQAAVVYRGDEVLGGGFIA